MDLKEAVRKTLREIKQEEAQNLKDYYSEFLGHFVEARFIGPERNYVYGILLKVDTVGIWVRAHGVVSNGKLAAPFLVPFGMIVAFCSYGKKTQEEQQ